jgi:hypothetical protein
VQQKKTNSFSHFDFEIPMRLAVIFIVLANLCACAAQQSHQVTDDDQLWQQGQQCLDAFPVAAGRDTAVSRTQCLNNIRVYYALRINSPYIALLYHYNADALQLAVAYSEGKLTYAEAAATEQKNKANYYKAAREQQQAQQQQSNMQAAQSLQNQQQQQQQSPNWNGLSAFGAALSANAVGSPSLGVAIGRASLGQPAPAAPVTTTCRPFGGGFQCSTP